MYFQLSSTFSAVTDLNFNCIIENQLNRRWESLVELDVQRFEHSSMDGYFMFVLQIIQWVAWIGIGCA